MTVKALYFRWAWTTIAAIAVFAVLAYVDLKLKAETGWGTVDLQKVWTANGVRAITIAWLARRDAAMAGFNLGFDYLFMPLYGFAFYYGTIAARLAFAPKPGGFRRIMTLLAAVPLAGAIFDCVENALETAMFVGTPTDQLAAISYAATNAKMTCFYIGAAMSLLGLVGVFVKRKAEPAPPP
ncbi:MAG TPA: hypothetical protein VGT78_13760 [Rhizomicrobium sp.]|nr:hypothetical protein [Rhizomicrobium sp.]